MGRLQAISHPEVLPSLQTKVSLWNVALLTYKKKPQPKNDGFICYPSGPGASKSQPFLDTAQQDPNGCFLN